MQTQKGPRKRALWRSTMHVSNLEDFEMTSTSEV